MATVTGLLIDTTREFVPGERETVVIDSPHQRIHDGVFFSGGFMDAALANGASLEAIFRVVDGAHARIVISLGGDGTFEGFENTVVSDPGTPVSVLNRNRFSPNVATNLLFQGPTITNDGDSLAAEFIFGGSGGQATGGTATFFLEWILAPGDHLMRLTNDSGQVRRAQMNLDWYEVR